MDRNTDGQEHGRFESWHELLQRFSCFAAKLPFEFLVFYV